MIDIRPALAGAYNLFSDYSKDVLGLTAQDLLDVAKWVEEHRSELQANPEQEDLFLPPDPTME